MTYIDAAMRGIKIDNELFPPEAREALRASIRESLILRHCPGDIWKGASGDPGKEKSCNRDGCCDECWAQEMEVRK